MHRSPVLFAGTANPDLTAAVARELHIPMGMCSIQRFPDGELSVRLDESVRGREVFLLQSTSPPVNDHLVELLAFVDACRRSAAERITAVVPYYGYARQDKRTGNREPITASMVAMLLQAVGVDHLLTLDLHTPQIEGFFHAPVDTLTAVPSLCHAVRRHLPSVVTVVSPDAGRVKLATEYAACLDAPLAVLHKRRESGTETRVTHLVGEVEGRVCLLVDDLISTAGTLVRSAESLRDAGASELHVAATHALLLDDARERLSGAGVRTLFVTDAVPVAPGGELPIHVISIAPLLARAIRRFAADGSLEELY